MKICVLISSYEGVESEFKDLSPYQDPSRYVKSHDFHLRYIRKDTAEQQIDQACAEGFDLYINFLWGQRSDSVAGIDAVQYLESKDLAFIGASSKFLLLTKTSDDISVEEFIVGQEFTVMVVEVDDDVIAMAPYVREFKNKIESLRRGIIQYELYDGELMELLQDTACKAYRALDVFGSSYGRVDIRVAADNSIFVLGVNPIPALFYDTNTLDDEIISQCFPGGHEGLMENLIATKLRSHTERQIKKNFDVMSDSYDDHANSPQVSYPQVFGKIVAKFPFQGTVLDLGSGTGIFGSLIQASYDSTLTGIDLSPLMAAKAKHYKKVYTGTIQRILPFVGHFDHVVSSGALYYLDKESLLEVMDRCFVIAEQSITFGIEEIPDSYNKHLTEIGKGEMCSHNHTFIIDSYMVPEGWHLIYKERHFLWSSPKTGDDVHGTIYRFERVES